MPVSLADLARARDAMFEALIATLVADTRTVAAWLSGSHGRGEDDEWSDFDFHLAVDDDAMPAVLADPMSWFAMAGEVLLVQANFPSDSMPEGRFWLVIYAGPFQIDWNTGPASAAARPAASRLLFEKQPVPIAADPPPLAAEAVRDEAQRTLEFFWAMAPIAVKYAGRGWSSQAVQQVALLRRAYMRLWRLVDSPPVRGPDAYDQNRPPEPELLASIPDFAGTIDPPECLRVIATFCEAVSELHPGLESRGFAVPLRMPAEVVHLIAIAQTETATGAVRRGTGRFR
jgi:hypothetical protein